MKFLCFILTILSLCVVYKDINGFRNEKLNILNESDKGLHCEARIVTRNKPKNIIYEYNNCELRNDFFNRSPTRCFYVNNFFTNSHNMYMFKVLFQILINCEYNLDNHNIRIKWFYLG